MLDFDLYSIYVTLDENDGRDLELFRTFDAAMRARMHFGNWMREKGDVYIRRFVDGHMGTAKEIWHVCADGTIDFHY